MMALHFLICFHRKLKETEKDTKVIAKLVFPFSYLQNVGHHRNQFIVILDFIVFAIGIYNV